MYLNFEIFYYIIKVWTGQSSGNKQQKDAYKNSDLVLLSKATQLPALFCILPLALDILEIRWVQNAKYLHLCTLGHDVLML